MTEGRPAGKTNAVRTFVLNLLLLLVLEGAFFLAFARPLEPMLLAWYVFAFLFSLPGAIAYLLILRAVPRRWSRGKRRAFAVLLSPLVLGVIWAFFYRYGIGILVFLIGTTAYGLTVMLPGEPSPLSTTMRVLRRSAA